MANTTTLKRRIGSIRSTRQITKAMELVAASKMRRTVSVAQRGRAYREAAHSLLSRLNSITDISEHPLFQKREIKHRLYVVITSDRGLAGAYNANVLKLVTRRLQEDRSNGIAHSLIIIGKRGASVLKRIENLNLIAAYADIGDHPDANNIRPILNTIIDEYLEARVDDVQLFFTVHRSNFLQVASSLSILPASIEDTSEDNLQGSINEPVNSLSSTTFEPSVEEVLDSVTERLLEVQIWQALLESNASEQNMRMLAMKNATDNAGDIIEDLTLAFNSARQTKITQELAEITGGAEAMKET